MATIAVLFHARDRGRELRRYAVVHLAELWRARGHEVRFQFGTRRLEPATLSLLHVDLSVVPRAYSAFAGSLPLVLNSRIDDIRKSVHSRNLVHPGDGWAGPVIVKTDLNYAGVAERSYRGPLTRLSDRVTRIARCGGTPPTSIRDKTEYRVYERPADVPAAVWRRRELVVEKFLPERLGASYATRSCYLLGGALVCERAVSTLPVVSDASAELIENVEPHSALLRLAAELRLDYGKLDYTEHDGEVVLLDVNKTVGASLAAANPRLRENRAVWAAGLDDFLEGRRAPL